ncbi:MAG: hypothetical protein IJS15_14660 [Victivallales bacterium]|nr:hypothetical protein [Victivallales bacterium]
MKNICTNNHSEAKPYSPLPLGNGDLSLMIDYTGNTTTKFYCNNHIQTGIWRAGYRLDNAQSELVSFGHFEHVLPANAMEKEWTQQLNLDFPSVECRCTYDSGVTVETEAYCLLNYNLVVIRKRVIGDAPLKVRYHFKPRRTTTVALDNERTAYEIDSWKPIRGMVAFFSKDEGMTASRSGDDILLSSNNDRGVFYLAFDEDALMFAKEHTEEEIASEHTVAWAAFWRESTVPVDRLPKKHQQAARTAEYHLRLSSTNWSIPTGVYPTHWRGLYFAFDEFFPLMGLLASGHVSLACKIPRFRFSMLDAARQRAYRYFGDGDSSLPARFVWEASEEPGRECAVSGFWLEHIFHHANIALGAWHCYKANHDIEFLRDIAYPLMSSCAEFFRIFCVCEKEPGRFIIGKCTDLERLGAARENPFMTTCGAIATFRAAAEAAELLGKDEVLQAQWRLMDEKLTETLPQNEVAYIPYPGCQDKSIALLSGVFPYGNLQKDNAKSRKAIDDFCACEAQFGNMYPVGKSLCTWYAGWKALTFLRLGETEIAKKVIDEMVEDTGNFSEVFEIAETGNHPWFTTGEGCLLQAICEAYRQ